MIKLKAGWNQFFGPKFCSRDPKLPKIYLANCWRRRKLVDITMNNLRYVYPSDNRKCPKKHFFSFRGLIMTKLHDFLYLVNNQLLSCSIPQNECKDGFTMDVLRYACFSNNRKYPENIFMSFFFSGFTEWNFKRFQITRTIHHITLADLSKWPKDPSFYQCHLSITAILELVFKKCLEVLRFSLYSRKVNGFLSLWQLFCLANFITW